MSCCWSTVAATLLAAFALIFVLNLQETEAKRGCSNFGHSCYGGMGKRGSDLMDTNEEILQDVQQQDENPGLVFTGPRDGYKPERGQKFLPQHIYNLSPIIRQWLQSYRKAQEMHTDNI